MVIMESVSASEVAAVTALAAHRTAPTWYDPSAHQAHAEEYLKASNNSYFSQMSSYHGMAAAHSQHGKKTGFEGEIGFLKNLL